MNCFAPRSQSIERGGSQIRLCIVLIVGALIGVGSIGWCTGADPAPARGEVLLVRGVFTVFSLGLDDLALQLNRRGYATEVVPASLSHLAVDGICKRHASGASRAPLVLIGHSLGGDLLPGLAERLAAERLPVDLLIMIDSTFPSDCPANVRRCVNLYQSNFSPEWLRVFRGAPIQATSTATELVNVDIRKLPNQSEAAKLNHFNIEASPWIHKMVIEEVSRTLEPKGARPVRLPGVHGLPVSRDEAGVVMPARRVGMLR